MNGVTWATQFAHMAHVAVIRKRLGRWATCFQSPAAQLIAAWGKELVWIGGGWW
jgi:hypothetical protein